LNPIFLILLIIHTSSVFLSLIVVSKTFHLRKFGYIIFAGFFLLTGEISGQIGGTFTWNFLNLTSSARISALGGKNVALADGDLNLAYFNPSLLTEEIHNNLALNYATLFSGISYGNVAYARTVPKIGTFAGGIQYINYGTFTAADETGQITGQFRAAEYALYFTYSKTFDTCWNVGITFKPVYSSLERYQAFGVAADLGASYISPNRLFTAGLVLRNMGLQFKGYYTESKEPLPFEILAGVAQKLQYAPLRFLITLQQLQRFDLTYNNPDDPNDIDPITGKTIRKNPAEKLADQVMRHIILGVEFVPSRSFFFRLGYNYQRRKEMMIDTHPGTVGFSWGFGLRINKFNISYGRAAWHLAGGTNFFSLSTNFSEFGFLDKSTNH